MENETVLAKTNVDFMFPPKPEGPFDERAWVKNGLLTITNLYFRLSTATATQAIPLKGLEDVDMRIAGERSMLVMTRYDEGNFKSYAISASPKALETLRKFFIQFISDAFKTSIYFISPASRGGVVLTNVAWDKGLLLATQKSIWFMSKDKQIRVGLDSITKIKREARKMGGKDRYVLSVDYFEKNESLSSLVLCPDNTMDLLERYLTDLMEKYNSLGEDQKLTDIEGQVATLIYSGVDSNTIQSMLSIDNKTMDQYYDKLLKLGMANVVRVRRELELTPRGVKFVTDMMSNFTTEKK
ncbi:CheF family chemotaxis protein [Methanocella sp. MCL-LM]|uniref:CheF family chemotaxis protein n=1 Tax=Methanocella sp. MCL-LM TaxID=3412035 RepID=UPI003C73C9AF